MSENKSNPVGWFDIYVDDMERAVAFYQAVFKQKFENLADPAGEIQMMSFPSDMALYGASGALVKSENSSPGIGGTVVYFSVEDCSVEESRVADAGGKVIKPKLSIGEHGWIALCQDTEGNIFGLHSMK